MSKKIQCDFSREKNGNAKLNQEKADEIRSKYKNEGLSQRELAYMFSISKTHTRRIIKYESWA
jgi:DNA invertase Pin-like site-specific DNA recombinase